MYACWMWIQPKNDFACNSMLFRLRVFLDPVSMKPDKLVRCSIAYVHDNRDRLHTIISNISKWNVLVRVHKSFGTFNYTRIIKNGHLHQRQRNKYLDIEILRSPCPDYRLADVYLSSTPKNTSYAIASYYLLIAPLALLTIHPFSCPRIWHWQSISHPNVHENHTFLTIGDTIIDVVPFSDYSCLCQRSHPKDTGKLSLE